MSRWDKLLIQFAVNPLFPLRRRARPGPPAPRSGSRSRFLQLPLEFDAGNDFERVVRRILQVHVPLSFLTYYPDRHSDTPFPRVWVGSDIYGEADAAYRVAHTVEKGGEWIAAQHGGGYGQVLSLGHGKVELGTAGGFVTWGWSTANGYSAACHPLSSPMLSRLPRYRERNDHLLYVGTMVPPYHYRFQSLIQPDGILEYLQCKTRFISHTRPAIRERLLYRPYLYDFGVGEVDFVKAAAPDCRILDSGPLTAMLCSARLVVIDHISTTFLEALAAGVPTILFWDPAVFALAPDAQPFFDELRSAGILFDTPEAAARKVNQVWSDVRGWWRQQEVQRATERFRRQYALSSRRWRKEWAAFLKKQLLLTPP